ncbi:hypothetical protein SAY87_022704 [Trapa incisa]|uniref:Uncharacterized protein n=1 Tax=Trapa incisa TaxID=236973 RepID=A0AAN7Q538_9MYRT|nr:hypothetical protein SAY87_022704 [Trapa incisa]
MVKGKVVYCVESMDQENTIKKLGGIGIITSTDLQSDLADTTLILGTTVSSKDGMNIDRYISSSKKPEVSISKTRDVRVLAPFVASFSASGPQSISPNIFKVQSCLFILALLYHYLLTLRHILHHPRIVLCFLCLNPGIQPDILAPGLGILAGYSKIPSVTGDPTDTRHSIFKILSGTSMACPHAVATAAYVKSMHMDWSPAAVRSALMTTATPVKVENRLDELSIGSGQINPVRASDPGLVYDIGMKSYISLLCYEGHNDTMIGLLIGGKTKFSCSSLKSAHGVDGINYPSLHIQLKNTSKVSGVFFRTVTNVGSSKSVYTATVMPPQGLNVEVIPRKLTFDRPGQKQSFKVIVKGAIKNSRKKSEVVTGSIAWSDSKHVVRSPMLIYVGR